MTNPTNITDAPRPEETPKPQSPPDAKAEEAKKKTLSEKLFTYTPVIMTVIATLLASMSASEMTQAQYHRATAAQHQSKVGDQYAFFQAKKIRGTSMAMTTTLLRALAEPATLSADAVRQSCDQLAEELGHAEREMQRLNETVRNLKPGNGEAGRVDSRLGRLPENVQKAQEKIAALRKKAEELKKTTGEALDKGTLKPAFGYLKEGLPKVERKKLSDVIQDPKALADIEKAAKAIKERQTDPEAQLEGKAGEPKEKFKKIMHRIPETDLRAAYNMAEDNARNFEKATDELKDSFRLINRLVQQQLDLARNFHRVVQDLNRSLPDTRADESQQWKDARATMANLVSTDRTVKDTVEQLYRDYRAASLDYDSRRYDQDAQDNLEGARYYELLVQKSNVESDRHMDRKTFLFYALLGAQAGVTIATLAMAVRQKSTLWSLATLAGVAAVSLGGYVALTM